MILVPRFHQIVDTSRSRAGQIDSEAFFWHLTDHNTACTPMSSGCKCRGGMREPGSDEPGILQLPIPDDHLSRNMEAIYVR